MYFTDRGIEELQQRRGDEEVTLAWLGDRLQEFTDTHPEFETAVERFATWLARLDDPRTDWPRSAGLADDLGYRIRRPTRSSDWSSGSPRPRPGAWLFSKVLRHLDDARRPASPAGGPVRPRCWPGCRCSTSTTTGRKSGLRRTSHLIAVPIDDTLALLGTNFGQPSTPAWVLNLEADPRADHHLPATHRRGGRPCRHRGRAGARCSPAPPRCTAAT